MQCKWQVEIDPYAQAVLAKHWPTVRRWNDVRTWPQPDTERVDVICGGFPCQDISVSGTGKGLSGERSGLWFEYLRILRELRPSFVAIENSPALFVRGFERILCDLAASGFDAEWQVVRASDFTLPHSRERLFVVAYANGEHGETRVGNHQNGKAEIFPKHLQQRDAVRVQTADSLVRANDGIRCESYKNRGHAVGNAVVPQVAEWIGRRIVEAAAVDCLADMSGEEMHESFVREVQCG